MQPELEEKAYFGIQVHLVMSIDHNIDQAHKAPGCDVISAVQCLASLKILVGH